MATMSYYPVPSEILDSPDALARGVQGLPGAGADADPPIQGDAEQWNLGR